MSEAPERKLIGDAEFGLTEDSVADDALRIRGDLAKLDDLDDLDDPDSPLKPHVRERMRTELAGVLASYETESAESIISLLRELYEYVKKREAKDMSPTEIIASIKSDAPHLLKAAKYYRVMRDHADWGYAVGQKLLL